MTTRTLIEGIVRGLLSWLLLFGSVAVAVDSPRSVFVKVVCNGKFSSEFVSSFKDEIRTSQKYQLVPSLEDNGRMGVVAEVLMTCAERETVVAVATAFGVARCWATNTCRSVVDGYSLNVALCDSKLASDCGRTLYKAFDAYMAARSPAQLKLD
jgi:hypothetical protein